MNNLKLIQASWITRKVQASDRPWLDIIREEIEKIKGE